MTPAARVAAAIEVLDAALGGVPAEQALIRWARSNRYAGSADRAGLRDLVYDALRRRASLAALGGALSGRGLMIGASRAQGDDPSAIFTGARFAPAPLSAAEAAGGRAPDALEALDCPPWLAPALQAALGAQFPAVMQAMQARAPVVLRVNSGRGTVADAQAALEAEEISTRPVALAQGALEVTRNARRVHASAAYRDGRVELQDAASQAAVERLDLAGVGAVLDYCAGGGGKALALAARLPAARITAHDVDPDRMADLPARAARAGVRIGRAAPGRIAGLFDLVLVDAPCSGSGTWRRTPEAKWRLTPARLDELVALQGRILADAAAHVAPGGSLAYMTCSLLEAENEAAIARFRGARGGWEPVAGARFSPLDGGDGFFMAQLRRPQAD